MQVFQVENYKAYATSALRDAKNGKSIIQKIKKEIGLTIEIISGTQEADMIYENHYAEQLSKTKAHLYIDVGGGSTELTLFYKNKVVDRCSFNIGTLRLVEHQVAKKDWDDMKKFILKITHGIQDIDAIGTGGNINKIFRISGKKDGKPLDIEYLENMYDQLKPLSIEERMHSFHLKEDRAEVIVPALQIYNSVMEWANIQDVYVPQIGLADGIIQVLHKEYLQSIGK
jgi:exopolyphosphatase / guanosine-5'-triphosphate,3'-diphosphate pyrophosphatase